MTLTNPTQLDMIRMYYSRQTKPLSSQSGHIELRTSKVLDESRERRRSEDKTADTYHQLWLWDEYEIDLSNEGEER